MDNDDDASGPARPIHGKHSGSKISVRSFVELSRSWGSKASLPTMRELVRQRRISRFAWACLGVSVVALLVTLFIFVSPGWGWTREIGANDPRWEGEYWVHYGLWYFCSKVVDGHARQYCVILSDLKTPPPFWQGSQALAVISLVFTGVTAVLCGMYVCGRRFNQSLKLILPIAVLAIFTGFVQVALFVSFCVMFLHTSYWCCPNDHQIVEYHLFYCFYLCPVAAVLHWSAGVVAIFEYIHLNHAERRQTVHDY